ncbi:MAG: tryptophan 2,3-dioxygenase family protein [Acidobacteriota bacterium]
MSLTYGEYLHVPELLDLQRLRSDPPEHDETLFIIIHQVYELWFKQVIHEVRGLRGALERGATAQSLATFKRILTIFKTMVAQVDVLETMTPTSFLSFRDRVENASGFQSAQFRVLEFLLGHRREGVLRHYEGEERASIEAVYEEPSLWDSFLDYLEAQGYQVPEELLRRDRRQPIPESEALQDLLVEIYHEQKETKVRDLCERFVDLDEALQEWRYRHVKMVERTIGFKKGTGGSSGAGYLRTTLFQPLFPDLWAIRSRL